MVKECPYPPIHDRKDKAVCDGGKHVFQVEIYLSGIEPNSVRVKLYADGVNGGELEQLEMRRGAALTEANAYTYSAQVPATRPATDYAAGVVPRHENVAVPLESARIRWQR